MPSTVVRLTAALCAALALWCSFGVLSVTDTGSDVSRIGLLRPFWQLLAAVAAACVLGLSRRIPTGRFQPLFLALLLLLPWLPTPIPHAFLVWSGPVTAVVWFAVLACVAFASDGSIGRAWMLRWTVDPARAPILAALLAFVLYSASARHISPQLPGGDEPHYLVIAQSLIHERDLQIEDNHKRREYRVYVKGDLKPDYLRRGRNNQIYSVHAPGLPAIVAPAFALFGYSGVVLFLALAASCGSALLWKTAYKVSASAPAAWFGWGSVAVTVPFFVHAFSIYPDTFASVLIMVVICQSITVGRGSMTRAGDGQSSEVIDDRESTTGLLMSGTAIGILPWLHTRFAFLSVVLSVSLLLRLTSRRPFPTRAVATLLVVPVLSVACWLGFFYVVYGVFDPSAPYGGYTQVALAHLLTGLPGLLFDQQFGLVANAPIYAVSIAGLVVLGRGQRMPASTSRSADGDPRLALEIVCLVAACALSAGSYRMWWGGHSAPARFLVSVLLPLGVPAAALWKWAATSATRALAASALGVSLFMTAVLVGVDHGRMLFNERDGFALWLEWMNPVVNLARGTPSFLRDSRGAAFLQTLVWVAWLLAAWLALRSWEKRRARTRAMLTLVTLGVLAVAIMGAFESVWRLAVVAAPTPATSQLNLLARFNTQKLPHAVDYSTGYVDDATRILPHMQISSTVRRPAPGGRPLLWLSVVPAGTYVLHIHRRTTGPGVLLAVIGSASLPAMTFDLSSLPFGDVEVPFRLPVGVRSLVVRGDAAATSSVDRLTLRPMSVANMDAELSSRIARAAVRYGAAVVYATTETVYLEPGGFWIGADAPGVFVVAPDQPGRSIRLSVRNAPVPNHVMIKAGKWQQRLDLTPGEVRLIDVPVDEGRSVALVSVTAAAGFHPADADPASTDMRLLGCWVALDQNLATPPK